MEIDALGLARDAAWLTVCLVWIVSARMNKPVIRSESGRFTVQHRALLAGAFVLLFSPLGQLGPLGWKVVLPSPAIEIGGTALTVAGALIAVWARWHLGGNWSAAVTIKERHSLVRTGPYRFVRHPIYTGLLLAAIGTAVAYGEVRGIVAVGLAFLAWFTKSKREEAFLESQFGEAYQGYRRETKALIPFLL